VLNKCCAIGIRTQWVLYCHFVPSVQPPAQFGNCVFCVLPTMHLDFCPLCISCSAPCLSYVVQGAPCSPYILPTVQSVFSAHCASSILSAVHPVFCPLCIYVIPMGILYSTQFATCIPSTAPVLCHSCVLYSVAMCPALLCISCSALCASIILSLCTLFSVTLGILYSAHWPTGHPLFCPLGILHSAYCVLCSLPIFCPQCILNSAHCAAYLYSAHCVSCIPPTCASCILPPCIPVFCPLCSLYILPIVHPVFFHLAFFPLRFLNSPIFVFCQSVSICYAWQCILFSGHCIHPLLPIPPLHPLFRTFLHALHSHCAVFFLY
jgi:hypothetical protein